MFLTIREQEKLLIYTAAKLAQERKDKGLKLNYPEAVAIISSFILEGARAGKSVAELMVESTRVLTATDLIDGVAATLELVQVEATFADGTKLVSVHNPVAATKSNIGEYLLQEVEIELNQGKTPLSLEVENCGDRPIQIGSHFHFFETNSALKFDRKSAYGKRLDIPAGTSVRFEPGSSKNVNLIDYGGKRYISGFNGLVEGFLDDATTKANAFRKLEKFLGAENENI